jgi:hypothetical protein
MIATITVAACTSRNDALKQHQEKLESLGASCAAIVDAWLGGAVSTRYTRTALEQIYQLVEHERTALVSEPQALADPRGAHLSEAAERLSRLLAVMMRDVDHGDQAGLRGHSSNIPIRPRQQS